jgi:hypothetical protein
MAASPSRLTRPLIAWAALGVLLALGTQLLLESLWIRAALPLLVWLALGLILVLVRLWPGRHAGARREALASAGAVVFVGVIVAVASPFLAQLGATFLERMRFERLRPVYEETVAAALEAGEPPGRHERDGVVYLLDAGPPARLAFPWASGTVFVWCGAVYDPTAEVLRINDLRPDGSNRDDPALVRLQSLFGGGLSDCHALADEYFSCCFTRPGLEAPSAEDLERPAS